MTAQKKTGWKKSIRCGANAGCVETARLSSVIGVRDSTLTDASPVLEFSRAEWAAFLERVKQP